MHMLRKTGSYMTNKMALDDLVVERTARQNGNKRICQKEGMWR